MYVVAFCLFLPFVLFFVLCLCFLLIYFYFCLFCVTSWRRCPSLFATLLSVFSSVCFPCFVFKEKIRDAPRPSEHPPVMGKKISRRLGGIKGCKCKTSSWHLNRFPDADNIGSTV